MVEPGSRASLGLKSSLAFAITRLPQRKDLHRDSPMQICIPSAEYGAHPAAAHKLLEQHVIKLLPLQCLTKLARVEHRRSHAHFMRWRCGNHRDVRVMRVD